MVDWASDIVISGAGLACSLGVGREDAWRAVQSGEIGLGPYTQIETPEQAERGGGEVPPTAGVLGSAEQDGPREAAYLRFAIEEALRHAGLDPQRQADWPIPPARCGVMLGTTLHGMTAAGKMVRSGSAEPLRDFLAPAVIARATRHLRLEGFAATTCSACSSGLGSLLLAGTLLRSGELDLVVAGGYDPISEYAYAGFNSLRLVDERLPRPFARDRAGMKVSEGYGIFVVERGPDLSRRGGNAFLHLRGGGESADAHHLTQPMQDGRGAGRAIRRALDQAGLAADQIDLIVAHATGTPDNDAAEVAALSGALGERLARVPTVGLKSRLGHTLGAAGAAELILAGLALRDQVLPTTATTTAADVDFENLCLATPDHAADWPGGTTTLNTSLGFGGANTCVIASTHPPHPPLPSPHPSRSAEPPARPPLGREVWITGIGLVLPGIVGLPAWADHLASGRRAAAGPVDEASYLHLIHARRARRLSDYVKLTLVAANLAFDDAAVPDDQRDAFTADCAGLLGTAHGSTHYSYDYYRGIVEHGLSTANPMLFAEGVPNAGAAHLSMSLKLRGACQSIIGSRTAGLDALRLAALRIADPTDAGLERCVVCAGEEHDELVERCYAELGLPMQTCGAAVAFVLESKASAMARGIDPARVHGSVEAGRTVAYHDRPHRGVRDLRHTLDAEVAAGSTMLYRVGSGTWLDPMEHAALRRSRWDTPRVDEVLCDLSDHVPECFSAGPLLAMAAHLVPDPLKHSTDGADLGPMPRSDSISSRPPAAASRSAESRRDAPMGAGTASAVASIVAGDFNGLASVARIRRGIH